LGKGVRLEQARRRAAGLPELDDALDVFHALREGGCALRKTWGAATRVLERAEVAQKGLDRLGLQGRSRQGHGTATHRLWDQAERAGIRPRPPRRPGGEPGRHSSSSRPKAASTTGPRPGRSSRRVRPVNRIYSPGETAPMMERFL
jgi:hypothetical protein